MDTFWHVVALYKLLSRPISFGLLKILGLESDKPYGDLSILVIFPIYKDIELRYIRWVN